MAQERREVLWSWRWGSLPRWQGSWAFAIVEVSAVCRFIFPGTIGTQSCVLPHFLLKNVEMLQMEASGAGKPQERRGANVEPCINLRGSQEDSPHCRTNSYYCNHSSPYRDMLGLLTDAEE